MIAGEFEELTVLYRASGAWEDPHGTFTGRDSIARHLEDGALHADFTEFERTSVLVGESVVAVEWLARGRSSPTATDLQPFETKIVGVFEMSQLNSELIDRSVCYFNTTELYNGRPLP